jgi:ankyrin repeat protein
VNEDGSSIVASRCNGVPGSGPQNPPRTRCVATGLPEPAANRLCGYSYKPYITDQSRYTVYSVAMDREFLKAVQKNNLTRVKELIELGVDVNMETLQKGYHMTPLFAAIYQLHTSLTHRPKHQSLEIFRLLVDKGADISKRSKRIDGYTPLFAAISSGCVSAVVHLLKNGADVSTRASGGNTVCTHAAHESQPTILMLLLQYGADPLLCDNLGKTPLHYATVCALPSGDTIQSCGTGCVDILSILVDNGADVMAKTKAGWTALDMSKRTKRAYADKGDEWASQCPFVNDNVAACVDFLEPLVEQEEHRLKFEAFAMTQHEKAGDLSAARALDDDTLRMIRRFYQ